MPSRFGILQFSNAYPVLYLFEMKSYTKSITALLIVSYLQN